MATMLHSVPSEDQSDASSTNFPIFEDGSESGASGQPKSQPNPPPNNLSFDLLSDASADGHHHHLSNELRSVLPLNLASHNALVGNMIHISSPLAQPSAAPLAAHQTPYTSQPGPTSDEPRPPAPQPLPPVVANKKNPLIVRRWMTTSRRRRRGEATSAVDARNDAFARDDWEAAPRSPLQHSKTRSLLWRVTAAAPSSAASSLPGDFHHHTAASVYGETRSTATTSSHNSTRSHRIVAGILQNHRRYHHNHHYHYSWPAGRHAAAVCDLDTPRCTGETVVAALALGSEGSAALQALRGRAGAVVMETNDAEEDARWTNADDDAMQVPFLHVQADLWVPHYEEYVVRKVDAFGRHLVSTSSSPLPSTKKSSD